MLKPGRHRKPLFYQLVQHIPHQKSGDSIFTLNPNNKDQI